MAIGGLLPWPGGALDWVVRTIAAIGLLLIAWAASAIRRWLQNGVSVFQMASVPGVIGGRLAGVIQIGPNVRPDETFRLALSCIRRITTGSGEDSTTREDILWQSEHPVGPESATDRQGKSCVSVLFEIPYDCRPTVTVPNDSTAWRLEIAAQAGGRYRARFDVPVFKTPQSDPAFVADDGPTAALSDRSDPQRNLREAGVICTVAPDGDGLRFFFPVVGTRQGLSA